MTPPPARTKTELIAATVAAAHRYASNERTEAKIQQRVNKCGNCPYAQPDPSVQLTTSVGTISAYRCRYHACNCFLHNKISNLDSDCDKWDQ